METIGIQLRENREDKQLTMRDVSAMTGIDPAIISKMESGERLPTEKQLAAMAYLYQLDQGELQIRWLGERILRLLDDEPAALEALEFAKSQLGLRNKKVEVEIPEVSPELKEKLAKADFMKGLIEKKIPLEPDQQLKRREQFTHEFIYEVNRMEDNVFSLQDTEAILKEGVTIPGKNLRQHLEIINHLDAVDYIRQIAKGKEKLNIHILQKLHKLIHHNIDRQNAGQFRSGSLDNPKGNAVLPQSKELENQLDELFEYYYLYRNALHPVLLSAELHQRFLKIQPFNEGNGFVAHLLLNYELLRNDYSLTFLHGDSIGKKNYLQALEQIQIGSDTESFYSLVANATADCLRNHLEWQPLWY